MEFEELFELNEPVHNDAAALFFVEEDLQARQRVAGLLRTLVPALSDDDLNQLLVRLYGQANPHVVYRVLNNEFARLSNMLRDPAELVAFHVNRVLASA